MTDQFEQLLKELGTIFQLSLHTDKSGACTLLIPPELAIQLQLDASQERLFLFSKLIVLPPGKFRENVLREGLKANAAPDPLPGCLAYLSSTNHLVLFQSYPLFILNGKRLAGLFGGFFEMTDSWRKAIERGQTAPPPKGSPPSL